MVMIDDGFDYEFYVCNSKGKLVMGFDDKGEAKNYAKANHYRLNSKNDILRKKINPENISNWTINFPEKGLVER